LIQDFDLVNYMYRKYIGMYICFNFTLLLLLLNLIYIFLIILIYLNFI